MELLESQKSQNFIESYGIRDTNLDEIFVKVAKDHEAEIEQHAEIPSDAVF